MARGAAIGGLLLVAGTLLAGSAVAGCGTADPAPDDRPARPLRRDTEPRARTPLPASSSPRSATSTASAAGAVSARGDGVLRDEAPPQRRYRIVSDGRGGTRVVQEPDVLALPGAERPTRIPDPEIAEPPPTPQEGPRVIEAAPPR